MRRVRVYLPPTSEYDNHDWYLSHRGLRDELSREGAVETIVMAHRKPVVYLPEDTDRVGLELILVYLAQPSAEYVAWIVATAAMFLDSCSVPVMAFPNAETHDGPRVLMLLQQFAHAARIPSLVFPCQGLLPISNGSNTLEWRDFVAKLHDIRK